MSAYTLADASTGLFVGALTCREDLVETNTPPGCVAVPGAHDPQSQRLDIETGEVVAYTPPAPDPAVQMAAIEHEARAERARRLASTDWIVTRSAERGEPVPQPWRAYRQALRDIPTQPGWPASIDWPPHPERTAT